MPLRAGFAGDPRQWLATFRLGWADERHLLTVMVWAGASAAAAETRARQALAGHLRRLADEVGRCGEPPAPHSASVGRLTSAAEPQLVWRPHDHERGALAAEDTHVEDHASAGISHG